jgi:DNA-binding MarR family transcriptional regulator/GNAT superfamily N-acetyltransferase
VAFTTVLASTVGASLYRVIAAPSRILDIAEQLSVGDRRCATGSRILDMSNKIVDVVNDIASNGIAINDAVARVRAFNRFYTRVIGVLDGGHLGTPFSLVEARLLYELAHHKDPGGGVGDGAGVADLRRRLDLDAGYLSRILGRLESDGLVRREQDPGDARRQLVALTAAGRDAFVDLDRRQVGSVETLLHPLRPERCDALIEAMRTITEVLEPRTEPRGFVLRGPEPGDLGWVVARHGALYAREYGWDATFETMVARIVADYAAGHDPVRESGWIAEVDGRPAGSVFCVASAKDPEHTAKLRLLLVEPSARGLGVGARLVEECLRFARRAGYTRITLWTNGALHAARRIYQGAGFTLDDETTRCAFGGEQVEQNWSRAL